MVFNTICKGCKNDGLKLVKKYAENIITIHKTHIKIHCIYNNKYTLNMHKQT